MSTVNDLIEISGLNFNSDLTVENGGLIGAQTPNPKPQTPNPISNSIKTLIKK